MAGLVEDNLCAGLGKRGCVQLTEQRRKFVADSIALHPEDAEQLCLEAPKCKLPRRPQRRKLVDVDVVSFTSYIHELQQILGSDAPAPARFLFSMFGAFYVRVRMIGSWSSVAAG